MKSTQKDNTVLRVREEYVSPALEVFSMELKTSLLLGSPGTPGDDEEIIDHGGY